jgi:diguanylate cyclase (GGDEF)-like protein
MTTPPALLTPTPRAQSFSRQLFYSHLVCALLVACAVAGYLYWVLSVDLQNAERTRLQQAALELDSQLSALAPEQAAAQSKLNAVLMDVVRSHQLSNLVLIRDGKSLAALGEGSQSDHGLDTEVTLSYAPNARARLAIGASNRHARLSEIRNYALLGFIGAVALAFLFAQWFARRIQKTINLLVGRFEQVAAGQFDARMSDIGDDAMGRIAHSFNHMSERLQKNVSERERMLEQLKFTRDRLEVNMRDRTQELAELNELFRKEHEQRARLEANLAEAAGTDPLTRLLNRRSMLELLREVAKELKRRGRSGCLAIVDIDHFKQVNDRFGHDVGDDVLASVSALIRTHLGADEAAARWGGEEFLIAWPDQVTSVAEQRANRLREVLADRSFAGGKLHISASFGVTDWQHDEPVETALKRADRALYEAKSAGRNRVCVQRSGPI